jgi:hypothetical protein
MAVSVPPYYAASGESWRGAMRYLSAIALCCLIAPCAVAQEGGTIGADITAYGIMSGPAAVPDGMSTGGIVHLLSGANKIIQTTTTVPACIGVRFGAAFSVAGSPGGASADITEIFRFPPPGVNKPGAPTPIPETRFVRRYAVGATVDQLWYEFDDPWELVPGEWTFELRDGDRLLASKTFTVVPSGRCPKLTA